MPPERNGAPCPVQADAVDCMPGDTCATPAECCVDSSTSGNEYNRCLDRCEPTVASRSPTSQAVVVPLESCCIVDYTKCHEWECVAYCNKVYLSTSSVPGFLAKSQEIKAYCDAFNAVVKSRGQSCRAYSGGIARDEGGGGSGLDCTGQKYVEAKTSLLDRSHHGCIRCVSSGLKYCPADGRCAEDPNNEAEVEDKEPLRCPASCVGEFYPVSMFNDRRSDCVAWVGHISPPDTDILACSTADYPGQPKSSTAVTMGSIGVLLLMFAVQPLLLLSS